MHKFSNISIFVSQFAIPKYNYCLDFWIIFTPFKKAGGSHRHVAARIFKISINRHKWLVYLSSQSLHFVRSVPSEFTN